ncbi:diguanylate cyclase [Aliarcobacter butzleri]|uniref:diguanylate cyclase domain-containing protein n=1 Tax=Aliarcobacter butzleri TaxID=28197 RepID=UPI0021B337A4|nr:diguanylate cyclase [Aliarcobacter butzleri]MCT7562546.1 diguanylate cyclase [Aliarcobacter butzleri]
MKKEINTKNFTYNWFILSIFIILTIILLQGYIEYKRSVENAIVKTSNLTILLTKKLENGKKTCSIGGTIYEENEDILKTIKRADEAVYEAKAAGRNKVIIV